MNVRSTALWFLLLSIISESHELIDPISGTVFAGIASALYYGFSYHAKRCERMECCNDKWIPKDIEALRADLTRHVFGQHIAVQTVLSALEAHKRRQKKALTMSFHGLNGAGKNYVSQKIALAYFEKGQASGYYHFFNGRSEFPDQNELELYKDELTFEIMKALNRCPNSVFVFDEVDMMVPGLLNVLVPFLEYGDHNIRYKGMFVDGVLKNQAIYIFLSNTGSQDIVNQLISLWQDGKSRSETRMHDFENLISMGAFNERGGFHRSDTIRSSLIDYYVPFLPLEKEHVILCVKAAFAEWNRKPTPEQIDEAMMHVTYAKPHNLYAKGGCKRIDTKVNSILYQRPISN